jgi:chaperonin cofactor prefoldin
MVEALKEQMKTVLLASVNKTQGLQKQLDTVTAKKQELEQQLAATRQRLQCVSVHDANA